MTNTISNTDDTIDSRDVIARIEELTTERDDFAESCDENLRDRQVAAWDDTDEGKELTALTQLASEAEGYAADWQYGEQLIRDSYFPQAMDEMIADCYDFGKDLPFWATITLDYDALRQDYTSVYFDGVTYWVR